MPCLVDPTGSPLRGGDVAVYVFVINQRSSPIPFFSSLFLCSCVYFCLYDPFNCISCHMFSRQLSAFSLCSFGPIPALSVLSASYFSTKVSFSPDIYSFVVWLCLKHELSNFVLCMRQSTMGPGRLLPRPTFCSSSLNDVSFCKLDLLLKET